MIIRKSKNNFISKDELFSLYTVDYNNFLPKFKEKFDLIFVDPPYFISNDGISIQNREITSVNKGSWDRYDNIKKSMSLILKWIKIHKNNLSKLIIS